MSEYDKSPETGTGNEISDDNDILGGMDSSELADLNAQLWKFTPPDYETETKPKAGRNEMKLLDGKYIRVATNLVKQYRDAKTDEERESVITSIIDEDLCVIEALIRSSNLGRYVVDEDS